MIYQKNMNENSGIGAPINVAERLFTILKNRQLTLQELVVLLHLESDEPLRDAMKTNLIPSDLVAMLNDCFPEYSEMWLRTGTGQRYDEQIVAERFMQPAMY